jgi:Sulfotransferase family
MLRSLVNLGNEHLFRPFDLMIARRSHVPCYANSAAQKIGGKRVAFFHAPKCGGTSINQSLSKVFGGPAGLDPIAAEAAARNLDMQRLELREAVLTYFVQRNDAKFISGHYSYSRRAFLGREDEFDLLTILRNPLDRMLSHYYFNRFKPARNHLPIDCELPEWLATDEARAAATTFTKMFVGDIEVARAMDQSGRCADMQAAVAEAIGNLGRFAIVGTLERLKEFEAAIQQRYHVRPSIEHLRKNPLPGYPKFSEQPLEVRDRLLELCQEDMAIYERFSKEPRPEGTFHSVPRAA